MALNLFLKGKLHIKYKNFLGYTKDKEDKLIIDEK